MSEENILNKVISFISGGSELEGDDKQMLLRQLAKEIQQNKYAKFYRSRSEEADPSFAQYFYSIYKLVYPARNFFKDPEVMKKIRRILLESHLDKSTLDVIKHLSPEVVQERKKKAGPDFTAELEKDLEALTIGFDGPKLAIADKCYDLMTVFNRFVSWDYYNLLKKFDHDMSDGFTSIPKFSAVKTDTIMADIASFISVLPSFDPEDNWKTVLEVFKYCRGGADLIPMDVWNGLLANLKDLKLSRMLESMVRLASGNPIWEHKNTHHHEEHLSSDWLAEKTGEIRHVISGISNAQKNVQIAALEKAIFGESDTTRLTYYNKDRARILIEKGVGLDPYAYAPALNHIAAFVQDFIKKEMEEMADILLVRGQWTKNSSFNVMSEAYHNINESYPEIIELDESLAEDGSYGTRLRGSLLRVDRDHSQIKYLGNLVNSLNTDALNLIKRMVPSFVVIGKHFKVLMEDSQKKSYELIMNWKELALLSKVPIAQRLGEDYKRVNYLIQLILLQAQMDEEE